MMEVDNELCIVHEGCTKCIESCPVECISIDTNNKIKIDNVGCIDCKACAGVCSVGAISEG